LLLEVGFHIFVFKLNWRNLVRVIALKIRASVLVMLIIVVVIVVCASSPVVEAGRRSIPVIIILFISFSIA